MTLTEYYNRMAWWSYENPTLQILKNVEDGLYNLEGIPVIVSPTLQILKNVEDGLYDRPKSMNSGPLLS